MIIITPYRSTWPAEFTALGIALRQTLGELALRIDHIGSSAVPGLAAKDIIDVQVCDIVMIGAELWAMRAGWKPSISDC